MQRHWTDEELALYWSLATNELAVLPPGDASSRLGVALSLKFCQLEGRFPRAAKGCVANFAQEVVKGQSPLSVWGIKRPGSRTVRPQ